MEGYRCRPRCDKKHHFFFLMIDLPEYPADCTPEAKDFLDLAFETDYRKRSSASKLLKHSFLKPVLMFRKKARLQKMATAEAT